MNFILKKKEFEMKIMKCQTHASACTFSSKFDKDIWIGGGLNFFGGILKHQKNVKTIKSNDQTSITDG